VLLINSNISFSVGALNSLKNRSFISDLLTEKIN